MNDYLDYPIASQMPQYQYQDMNYPQQEMQMQPEYLEMPSPYREIYEPKMTTQPYYYERPVRTPNQNYKFFESKDTTTKKRNYAVTKKHRKNLSNCYMPVYYDDNFETKNEVVKTRFKSNSKINLNNTCSNFYSPFRYKNTHYHNKSPEYYSRNVENLGSQTIYTAQSPRSKVTKRVFVRNVPNVQVNDMQYYGQTDDMQFNPRMEPNFASQQDNYHQQERCQYCSKNHYPPSNYNVEPQYDYIQDFMTKDRRNSEQNFGSRSVERQFIRNRENQIKGSKINVNTTVHETDDKVVETKTIHTIKDPFGFSRYNYNFYESSDLRPKIEKKVINKMKPKKYEIVRGSNYRFYDCNTGYTTEKKNERIVAPGY